MMNNCMPQVAFRPCGHWLAVFLLLSITSCGDRTGSTGGEPKHTAAKPAETAASTPEQPPTHTGPNITVGMPERDQKVTGGFVLKGEARAFENTVNYRVVGERGEQVAEGNLMAVGDVGTMNPFTTEVTLPRNYAGRATVEVFQYSARDGRPVDVVKIPIAVRSQPATATDGATVRVFFTNAAMNGNGDCRNVFSIERPRGSSAAVAEHALKELLAGPTSSDREAGYATELPRGVMLRGIRITNGVAVANFSSQLRSSAGACRAEAIRAQIERTLFQFPSVQSVIIQVEGKEEEVLEP
ncbi:MAG: GerMN domain-containing protein [Armatimonadetes bacterium]|nr:GerMN domain-containing protein [Armatimonadota bacterium]